MMVSLMMLSCGEKSNAVAANGQTRQQKDYVEVLYFHGKQRCVTCRAIEKSTKELLEMRFAEQVKQGSVCLRVIDISQKENEAIAGKYGVTWSSLFVVSHKTGREKAENLTELAFAQARSNPDGFKAELQQRINNALR